ncbi:MAG TPA: SCO family protein [Candidatus Nanopelagicales bacterium]
MSASRTPPDRARDHHTPRQAAPRQRLLGLVSAVVLGLAGCSAAAPAAAPPVPTPANGTTLDVAVPTATAAIPLVDQAGRTVTLASLHGTTVVLVDFLTLCQEVCPLTSANVREVSDALDATHLSGDVRILETTVDPERDTPQRLAAYQKLYGAKPGWSLLTGTTADIAALWKSFGVGYEKSSTTAAPPPKDWLTGVPLTYDVDHQDVVIVIGPDGHERWLVDGTPKVSDPSAVPSSMQAFLNEDGHHNESAPADPTWTPADVVSAVTYVVKGSSGQS